MKYDFDTPVIRRGTDSTKWTVGENELPMWVADMDFKAAPEIIEALQKRLDHGVFGYAEIPGGWYDAYIKWWKTRHGFIMDKDGLIFCTGVIPAISSIMRKLTTPNENVLLLTPVYNIFYNSTVNNGCRVVECPLILNDGCYEIDFNDLEEKLSDPQTSLMILCNPHNPVGKIWNGQTLERIARLAKKCGVTVVSDEIHCDLTMPGKEYIPFASVCEEAREISITCIAPTKAFNLAGMQTAAVYVHDKFLRHKVWRALNTDEVAEPNSFATTAAIAAFSYGGEWLDELRKYIFDNSKLVEEFIKDEIPELKVIHGEATYLRWIDISALGMPSKLFTETLREKTGLFVTSGDVYGKGGEGFIRMNVACPRQVLNDGLNRLKLGVEIIKNRDNRLI